VAVGNCHKGESAAAALESLATLQLAVLRTTAALWTRPIGPEVAFDRQRNLLGRSRRCYFSLFVRSASEAYLRLSLLHLGVCFAGLY
jgi:hypothetical protein